MRTYLQLLDEILNHGIDRDDRTGVGTRGIFGRQMRFDLAAGFPLLTKNKKIIRVVASSYTVMGSRGLHDRPTKILTHRAVALAPLLSIGFAAL